MDLRSLTRLGEGHETARIGPAFLVHHRVVTEDLSGEVVHRVDDEPVVHAGHHLLLAAHHLHKREPLVRHLRVLRHRPRAELLDVLVVDVGDRLPSPCQARRDRGRESGNGGGDGEEHVDGPHGWVGIRAISWISTNFC
jgi:hypothetical protein